MWKDPAGGGLCRKPRHSSSYVLADDDFFGNPPDDFVLTVEDGAIPAGGLFHQFQHVRTCTPFLHGTKDQTQNLIWTFTSFLVRLVKLYRYWFSINMASSSADDTTSV